MNTLQTSENSDDSSIDEKIAEILERYLHDVEQGAAQPREQWLAEHPEYAERLAACLDGVQLFDEGETLGVKAAPQQTTAADPTPDSIGDYEILRELGRGGMGVVYEAREKTLDRVVALKVMRFGIVDPQALQRFQREAETAGSLHHTNIVPVYATGRTGDTSWYAMQRIEGTSLAAKITAANESKTPIELEEILRVGIQAAEALDHAHQRDVVHRDVKPANLIIDLDDRVWLTDFGLARRLLDVGATMTGAILGTPRYMSPEQADFRNTDVDRRSDIYSLGATLYEMAIGQPAFDGDEPLKLISKIRDDDPLPVHKLRDDLPRDFSVVIQKAMAKDADRRYASAAELADDLRAIREDRPIRAREISLVERAVRWTRRHQSRVRIAVATVLATAAMITVLLFGLRSWHESTLGSFRLRAAGGPYMTSIHPVGQSSLSDGAIQLTVPMQSHQKLPAGDFDMLLAPPGQWSRRLRLPITRGQQREYRLTGQPIERKTVPIDDTFAIAVADENEPAILSRQNGSLSRVTLSGKHDWQLDVAAIPTQVVTLTPQDQVTTDRVADVNFAVTGDLLNSNRGHRSLDDNCVYTDGQLALQSPIDLDGDGESDTLVAATEQAALMAVDHNGKTLWARSYEIAGLPAKSVIAAPHTASENLMVPGVLDLVDVGDLDDDGVHDIAALLCHLQFAVQADACVAVISGKSGDPIRAMFPPPVTATYGSRWPYDGVLGIQRHNQRSYRGVSFNSHRAYRSSSSGGYEFEIRVRRGSTPLRFALPSPLQWISDDSDNGKSGVIVYQAGDQCHRYEIASGTEIGSPLKLSFMPARKPVVMRRGGESILGFVDSQQTSAPGMGYVATLLEAFDLNGKPRWRHRLLLLEWGDAVGRNQPDWPLVADLNGDGNDEVVVPTSNYLNGVDLGIDVISSDDGKSLWDKTPVPQILGSADDCIARIGVSADLNGDGWRDLAVASFAGPPSPIAKKTSVHTGELYVYIDWISGRDGKSLAWARHPVTMLQQQLRVAEVDAVRTELSNTPPGTVEIDLLIGDSTTDNELASMVLRFHPSSPDPINVAAELDVVPTPPTRENVRVYRQRSGPYLDGPQQLTLQRDEPSPRLRLGENHLIASWKSQDGRSLVACSDGTSSPLCVIDADTLETVWTYQYDPSSMLQWTPVRYSNGRVDFLQRRVGLSDSPASLIDGQSGKTRWTMPIATSGRILSAYSFDNDRSIILIGDEPMSHAVGLQPGDALILTSVSSQSGAVRWSTEFLKKAARLNRPDHLDELQFMDVNRDGVVDVIGPQSYEDSRMLYLCVWDGRDGEVLWQRPLWIDGVNTRYFVPFDIVPGEVHDHIVYLGGQDKESPTATLHWCRADNGDLIDSISAGDRNMQSDFSRDSSHQQVVLSDCTAESDHPRVAWIAREGNTCVTRVYSLAESKLVVDPLPVSAFLDDRRHLMGMWMRDINGDKIPERLFLHWGSQKEELAIQDPAVTFTCLPLDSDVPIWRTEIDYPGSITRERWTQEHDKTIVWIRFYKSHHAGIDCETGRVIYESDDEWFSERNLPHIVSSPSQHNDEIITSSADGVFITSDGPETVLPVNANIHSSPDPRRRMPMISHARSPHALSDFLSSHLRGAIFMFAIVVLPCAYLVQTLRRRRWSLSWLLLAPPVLAIAIVGWQSTWLTQSDMAVTLLYGITPWTCVGALWIAADQWRQSRVHPDRKPIINTVLALALGGPVLIAILMFYEYFSANNETVQYTLAPADLVLISLIGFGLLCNIYWCLRIPVDIARLMGRGWRRLFSTKARA
ncbi:serine/threonine protein kinase [Stieleria varia]|uniref:non-specific serine/threonine protein kinase n=1 Tax=Stieleria varia TaxID=2528005 RepID=A0A5C6AS30_9BACT|nr:serine/threonine-protein kinase [Stieleria varia]TWU00974.1 Serine/threonine-protein kinase PknB [Stieleria varia]